MSKQLSNSSEKKQNTKPRNKFLSFRKTKKVEDIFSDTAQIVKVTTTNPLDEPEQTTPVRKEETKKSAPKQTKTKPASHQSILGSRESDNEQIKNSLTEDYTSVYDIKQIKAKNKKHVAHWQIRTILTFLLACVLIAVSVVLRFSPHLLTSFLGDNLTLFYISVNMLVLILAVMSCLDVIKNGLSFIKTRKISPDTPVALACVGCFLQCGISFLYLNKISILSLHLYSVLAIIALFFNVWSRFCIAARTSKNFNLLCSSSENYSVTLYSEKKFIKNISKSLKLKNPTVAYQRKSNFAENFFKHSELNTPADNISIKLAPAGAIISVLLFAFTLVSRRDVLSATSAMAVSLCVTIPAFCGVAINLPIKKICKNANKAGAVISGFSAIRNFSGTNAIMLDSKELYPKGSIELHGIKTFNGKKLDQALIAATAVICQFGGPLSPNFERLIHGKLSKLPRVDGEHFEEGKGIMGWVNGQRVLVGNRQLLRAHSIEPPTNSYEHPYLSQGYHLTYFANGGQLIAVFILSYKPNEEVKRKLKYIEKNDIKLIIRSVDPNISAEMIAHDFNLSYNSIKIMNDSESELYKEFSNIPTPSAEAEIVTKGSFSSFASAISSCISAKNNALLSLTIQVIALLLGISIISTILFFSGSYKISELSLVIYILSWAAACIIPPYFLRP